MAYFYFARRNDVSGGWTNVLGEKFDLEEVDENLVRANKKYVKKTYKNIEEFAKYCNLKRVK